MTNRSQSTEQVTTYTSNFDTDPTVTPGDSHYILSSNVNITVIVVTLLLALIAGTLNLSIMCYHYKKLKNSIVSFIYFILSLSDFCTGTCALLHSFIFIVMETNKVYMKSSVFLLVVPAYFLTLVAFKVSVFVSMLFSVIRTINITRPFRQINHRAVLTAIGTYTLLWVVMFSVEIGLILDTHLSKFGSNERKGIVYAVIGNYFYYSNTVHWAEIVRGSGDNVNEDIDERCVINMAHTVTPFTLCAVVVLVATVIQVVYLVFPQTSNASHSNNFIEANKKDKRRMSITIILISSLFVLCTSCSLYEPLRSCLHPSSLRSRALFYLLGYIPFFLNAAINPLILVIRAKGYRTFLSEKILGIKLDGPVSSVAKSKNLILTRISTLSPTKTVPK